MASCLSRGDDEEWHGEPAAAGLREESVLMQALHSSHSEVALSGTAMMTMTKTAGACRLQLCSDGECVWCKCMHRTNEWGWTGDMSLGGNLFGGKVKCCSREEHGRCYEFLCRFYVQRLLNVTVIIASSHSLFPYFPSIHPSSSFHLSLLLPFLILSQHSSFIIYFPLAFLPFLSQFPFFFALSSHDRTLLLSEYPETLDRS